MFQKKTAKKISTHKSCKLIKSCLLIFFFVLFKICIASKSYSAVCTNYLTLENQLTFINNPYLYSTDQLSIPEGLNSITQAVNTIYGPVILRTKDLKEQKETIETYGQDTFNVARFINGVLVGILKPRINHPQFVQWLQQSYEFSLYLRDINFNLPSSGFKPDFMLLRHPEQIQNAGRTEAIKTARSSGNIAPMIFQIEPNITGRPSEGLTENEQIWLFRILMREPYIRKLLRMKISFENISEDEFHEIVFFISAFPELYRLSNKLEKLGILPTKYQIADGHRIEGEELLLGRVGFDPLLSKLRLYKSFEGLKEHAFASIVISGTGLEQMSADQRTQLISYIHKSWNEFKDRFQTEFKLADIDIAITTKNMFNISVLSGLEENAEVTSMFYIFLFNGTRSFYF